MKRAFYRLFGSTTGSAAVEAAIFLPIFMLLTFGITDLGQAMFVRQQINASAQAGAMYAVINSAGTCAALPGACLSGIQTAMNTAVGNPTFCTSVGASCPASIDVCAGTAATPPTRCITVTANYSLIPILPVATYTWAQVMSISYTVTLRIS